jgi:hypothetical protein
MYDNRTVQCLRELNKANAARARLREACDQYRKDVKYWRQQAFEHSHEGKRLRKAIEEVILDIESVARNSTWRGTAGAAVILAFRKFLRKTLDA